jgi:hypothetical protein
VCFGFIHSDSTFSWSVVLVGGSGSGGRWDTQSAYTRVTPLSLSLFLSLLTFPHITMTQWQWHFTAQDSPQLLHSSSITSLTLVFFPPGSSSSFFCVCVPSPGKMPLLNRTNDLSLQRCIWMDYLDGRKREREREKTTLI